MDPLNVVSVVLGVASLIQGFTNKSDAGSLSKYLEESETLYRILREAKKAHDGLEVLKGTSVILADVSRETNDPRPSEIRGAALHFKKDLTQKIDDVREAIAFFKMLSFDGVERADSIATDLSRLKAGVENSCNEAKVFFESIEIFEPLYKKGDFASKSFGRCAENIDSSMGESLLHIDRILLHTIEIVCQLHRDAKSRTSALK